MAFANRQVITHQVRDAFAAVFGQSAAELGMELIYDVAHNIASKEWIYRQYDHEVQLRTVVKPGEDSGVLKITDTKGIALTCGCQPRATLLDPYTGGKTAIIENAMNLAVV